jgi:transposase
MKEEPMDVLVERCCGLDVHQKTVVACIITPGGGNKSRKEVRTFRTVTSELEALRAWLVESQISHVGMESTGVYWMPVYQVLACDELTLIVGNAAHIKNVPGRKSDVKDAEWLAHLVRYGLIRPSVVPTPMMRQLREYTRLRRTLVEERTSTRNRILRLLETANIKLASFASDVFGVSGSLMLDALIEGEQQPEQMASLAKGVLRKKRNDLSLALRGRMEEHHRYLLRLHRDRIAQIDHTIAQLDARIEEHLRAVESTVTRLVEVPGIDRVLAAVIIAELGTDMSYFPTHGHAAAWAGLAPGSNRSAGKKTRHESARYGNVYLRTALAQAATSACKVHGSHYREKYQRVQRRRGAGRAVIATAHAILVSVYHMLKSQTAYHERGPTRPTDTQKSAIAKRLKNRLEQLGFEVDVRAKAA